jgi:Carboxypeptidase regulatory-like domain
VRQIRFRSRSRVLGFVLGLGLVGVAAPAATVSAKARALGHVDGIAQVCGGAYPGPCRGVATSVSVLTPAGRAVATQETKSTGRFRFTLRPGVYKLVAALGGHPSKTVTLHPGRTVHVDLTVDVP